jgi:hypothetical protein
MDTASKQQYDPYLKEIRISKDMLKTAKSKGKVDLALILFNYKFLSLRMPKWKKKFSF